MHPEKPLVTLLIPLYGGLDLIYTSLDSILMQDYENIELIISDDGTPGFEAQEIESYIASNKGDNIHKVILNVNPVNMGTVRHLNRILDLYQGKYLKSVGMDDALADAHVISDFVNYFETSQALVVASNYDLYDSSLNKILGPGLSPHQVGLLKNLSPRDLYLRLANSELTFAPGVAFSRKFFDIYGAFDERYCLDEDWPMWLRISRLGCQIHWLDRITVKYRTSGLSSMENDYSENTMKRYVEDLQEVWTHEILPHKDLLPHEQWERGVFEHVRRDDWPLEFKTPTAKRYF